MVIDSGNLNNLNTRAKPSGSTVDKGGTSTDEGKSTTANPTSASASADRVQLSREAQSLNRLEAQMAASPDVDMDKVAAIKAAITEGRFSINAERIAENLLRQDELLG